MRLRILVPAPCTLGPRFRLRTAWALFVIPASAGGDTPGSGAAEGSPIQGRGRLLPRWDDSHRRPITAINSSGVGGCSIH